MLLMSATPHTRKLQHIIRLSAVCRSQYSSAKLYTLHCCALSLGRFCNVVMLILFVCFTGFRVAEVHAASHGKRLKDKATADITFSSWEEIEASKILQLQDPASTTAEELSHAILDANCSTSAEVEQPQSEPYSTAKSRPGHERRREQFSQIVSMSLLELHSNDAEPARMTHRNPPTPPTPASVPYTPHSALPAAITDLDGPHRHEASTETVSSASALRDRELGMHERHAFGGDSRRPVASVPLAKEAVAAAFSSVDEELGDDLGMLDVAAVHAVGAAAQHAPSCAASAHDNDSSAQDMEVRTPSQHVHIYSSSVVLFSEPVLVGMH